MKIPMVHELKIDKRFFNVILSGKKKCEIRRADRKFHIHDTLFLRETKYTGQEMRLLGKPLIYTGREVRRHITHIVHTPCIGMMSGFVVLSIE